MLIMSLNIRGIGKPSKNITLSYVRDIQKPNSIMLQDIMWEGKQVIEYLSKSWKECTFIVFDAIGRSCGLKTGWITNFMRLTKSMILVS